jgi:hypothetical protein
MTNTDGVYIEGRRIDSGDCSGPRSARNVLLHPDVDAAVFERRAAACCATAWPAPNARALG